MIDLVEGMNRTDVDLTSIITIETRVNGRIVSGDNGTEIVGATVSVAGKSTTSGSGGTFHIDNVPSGTQTLTVSKSGFGTVEIIVELTEGINNYVGFISLTPTGISTGSVSGKLEEVNPAGGHNLSMGDVLVKIGSYSGQANSEGFFTVSDMPLGHYSTLTVDGYIPININLEVIGDMDLGVVDMAPIAIEWEIKLINFKYDPHPPLYFDTPFDMNISVYAGLSLSQLNVPVSRSVTLKVNGQIIATRTIILTRTGDFPATGDFELGTILINEPGTYEIEADELSDTKTLEEFIPHNLVELTTPELLWETLITYTQ